MRPQTPVRSNSPINTPKIIFNYQTSPLRERPNVENRISNTPVIENKSQVVYSPFLQQQQPQQPQNLAAFNAENRKMHNITPQNTCKNKK
jgi:hypothetical protein